MKIYIIGFIALSALLFTSCEESDPVFPDEVILTCQDEVDMVAPLISQGVFDEEDLGAEFKGDVIIRSASAGCGNPITDLSFFAAHKFWQGRLTIESDDITNLDFLSTIEQFRGGLIIRNCSNLESIALPSCAFVGQVFDITDNPNLTSLQIGNDLPFEVYEEIVLDSVNILNNVELVEWLPGEETVNFVRFARILGNERLTNLTALGALSMPSSTFELDFYGTTVNEDGLNTSIDSLAMPIKTTITANEPDNDYTWLSMAKINSRFNDNGINIGRIDNFVIQGAVTALELCSLKSIADTTSLEIISTVTGSMVLITTQDLEDECQ